MPSSEDDNATQQTAIAIAVPLAIVAVLLAASVALLLLWRRRVQQRRKRETVTAQEPDMHGSPLGHCELQMTINRGFMMSATHGKRTTDPLSTISTTNCVDAGTMAAPRDEEDALVRALDHLRAQQVPFLGRYLVGGVSDRRRGGQGMGAMLQSNRCIAHIRARVSVLGC